MTLNLFDRQEGERLKSEGQESVELHNENFVADMREVAKRLSRLNGRVTSDELRFHAAHYGLKPKHPNAWGSIFRGTEWVCVGHTKSTLKSNHARTIKIWIFREANR